MKHIPLTQFESLARRLVEGSFSRLFGGQIEPLEVATRLARAMEDNRLDGYAPESYKIFLHPDDYQIVMAQNPRMQPELAAHVQLLAQQADLSLMSSPEVELVADANLRRQQIRVAATHMRPTDAPTQVHQQRKVVDEVLLEITKMDAFLIVEGQRHVLLQRPITTLGRRTDNDVVLDSASVSRYHAQIGWRNGRFVVYDVSGRGRTAVNDQPVTESVLQPGDVIALSGVPIIYGEGSQLQDSLPSVEPDEQTALMPPKE